MCVHGSSMYRRRGETRALVFWALHCRHRHVSLPPQAERTEQLCVLALPPDMGFPEFCTFMGSHFAKVWRGLGDAGSTVLWEWGGGWGWRVHCLSTAACRRRGPCVVPLMWSALSCGRGVLTVVHRVQVKEIQIVRREGSTIVCLVLLRFESQSAADAFYVAHNGQAVRGTCVCA